ncbi:DsbA family protein [Aeromicrobium sp. Leaf350]|uniref:DsbA family protein n=1 Tax=Aeromicrobium sp. Leaf350 TaxID=2876565 RepID=UPI001E3FB320|nr:DsbA family protein [Aeromicrobium sp. Leaf350]
MTRTRRPSRPLVLGCLLAVLGLGLAACGDDAEPDSSSESTASDESGSADADLTEIDPVEGIAYPETPADGAPVVELYTDFQCPSCEAFASTYLDDLRTAADDGRINLVFHQFAFLDRASSNQYSSRSANAAYCVFAEGGSTSYLDFYEALFDDQPAEGTAGPGDDDLVELAGTVGVTGIDDCVSGGAYADTVKDAADAATDADVSGTPTVLIDGEVVDLAELEQVFGELLAS